MSTHFFPPWEQITNAKVFPILYDETEQISEVKMRSGNSSHIAMLEHNSRLYPQLFATFYYIGYSTVQRTIKYAITGGILIISSDQGN
jgi:hypothetical protein